MREMIIDQCLGTGREYTREELQAAVNKALESRGMLPVKSKVTILQDINEMNEKFYRIYDEYGIVSERRGRKTFYRYRDGIGSIYNHCKRCAVCCKGSEGCPSWNGLTRCRLASISRL